MGWIAAWGAGIPRKEPKDHCHYIKVLGCLLGGRLPLPTYLVLNNRTTLLGPKPVPSMHNQYFEDYLRELKILQPTLTRYSHSKKLRNNNKTFGKSEIQIRTLRAGNPVIRKVCVKNWEVEMCSITFCRIY